MIFKNLIDMLKKTWQYLATALIATLLLRWKFGPELFDILGVIIFTGLILIGLWEFYSKKKLPTWVSFSLIVVGIFGLLIDGITSIQLIKSWILGG